MLLFSPLARAESSGRTTTYTYAVYDPVSNTIIWQPVPLPRSVASRERAKFLARAKRHGVKAKQVTRVEWNELAKTEKKAVRSLSQFYTLTMGPA